MPVLKPPLGAAIMRGRGQTSGLRLMLPLSEGAGLRLTDASLNGNVTTFSDTANTSWVQSPYGPAIYHGAESGVVLTVADSDTLDITGPFSIAALVRLDVDTYAWLNIIYKNGPTGATVPYSLYRDRATDRLALSVMASAATSDSALANFSIGEWHHIAVTYDSAKYAHFFVDGNPAGNAGPFAAFPSASTYPMIIGNLWKGAFAGAWLWARALSAGEIQRHYVDPFAMLRTARNWWQEWVASAAAASVTITAPLGTLTLTGLLPSFATASAATVPLGSLVLSGLLPAPAVASSLAAPLGSVVLGGQIGNTITTGAGATAPLATLTLNGLTHAITADTPVLVPLSALTLLGLEPTVTTEAAGEVVVAVPLGLLTLTGQTLTLSAEAITQAALGGLALTGYPATIGTAADAVTVTVPLGAISLVGIAPTYIGAGQLLYTEFRWEALPPRFTQTPQPPRITWTD